MQDFYSKYGNDPDKHEHDVANKELRIFNKKGDEYFIDLYIPHKSKTQTGKE